MKKIIIGARGSKLSLAYATKVKNLILESSKDVDIHIKTIKTSGDIHQDIKLSEIGGKNLFCKEIEENLIENNIDVAVHSLKDMESAEHKDLMIGAYIKRNDPRDVLISSKIKKINELKNNITIGSSSRRRELQLKKINKNISVVNLRGNIDTRIKKIEEKKLDAIILAAAGIKSLNLENKIGLIFEISEILPAAGQGIIAVQCRKDNKLISEIIREINDKKTSLCAQAERKMLQTIEGDCETAIGGLAEIHNNNLKLKAQLFSDLGDESFDYELTGRDVDATYIGKAVGEKLLSLAGKKFKKK
ncbi:hydroxymethylbilane synthase [Pelagibacteraceae bacterium]|jgi:hydroxymethylbilane synthase|nr:hydroxymethylbilane synthase [Pelagibacteraceae bacterium]|tara:strand:+ start:743 stop:1654 length:912 start_codon:yes stop_codon:yes gene_type:complete